MFIVIGAIQKVVMFRKEINARIKIVFSDMPSCDFIIIFVDDGSKKRIFDIV